MPLCANRRLRNTLSKKALSKGVGNAPFKISLKDTYPTNLKRDAAMKARTLKDEISAYSKLCEEGLELDHLGVVTIPSQI